MLRESQLRGYIDGVPKPMVQIGSRPLPWHLMKYYAQFGPSDDAGVSVIRFQ
jgi:glucose-1-phosphate cytidylyltransferase